jgi:exopolysaccharide biosynthesis polyprenyl glycosylphosphotransferase
MTVFGINIDRKQLLLLVLDGLLILLAMSLAHLLRLNQALTPENLAMQLSTRTGASLLAVLAHIGALYVLESYKLADDWSRPRNLLRPAVAAVGAGLLLAILFFLFPHWAFGRGVLVTQSGFVLLGTVGLRLALSRLVARKDQGELLLIIGAGKSGRYMAEALLNNCKGRVQILAFMDMRPEKDGMSYFDIPVHTPKLEALHEQVKALGVNRVIITGTHGWDDQFISALLDERVGGLQVESMAEAFKRLMGRVPVANVDTSFFLFGPGFVLNRNAMLRNLFRLVDIVVALVGILLASPLILITALVSLLAGGRPVIFAQERAGLGRKPFKLYKFRTMIKDAEKHSGPKWSQENDPRVTSWGRFLRRTRLDELPQLWNVLRGDMSLVGPRPEREHFIAQLEKEIPFYNLRFAIRPGVTGWAQVNYGYGASVEDAKIKLEYELFYIQEMSLMLYLLVVLKTIQTVLLHKGS